jgi:hypothetical protein
VRLMRCETILYLHFYFGLQGVVDVTQRLLPTRVISDLFFTICKLRERFCLQLAISDLLYADLLKYLQLL